MHHSYNRYQSRSIGVLLIHHKCITYGKLFAGKSQDSFQIKNVHDLVQI